MDKKQIVERAGSLQTREDLLTLLNDIKMSESSHIDRYPFRMNQLCYYCNPNNDKNRYKSFTIPKKTGGEREISAPQRGLKNMLHYVNMLLQTIYEPSEFATGFTPGRSIVDNASRHCNQNYVLNIDLKDFFPSIDQARVWRRLQLSPFNFKQPIANIIAGLCSMKVVSDNEDGSKNIKYVLPQGAPTSPTITNMICDTLDRRLGGLSRRFGLVYSRYADDITFSGMRNVFASDSPFMLELKRIIEDQKFTINQKKTRVQKKGHRQEVTGLIVSNKVNTTRKYTRELRQLLFMWERYGKDAINSKFITHYRANKTYVKGNPHIENVISGKLLFLKMVKGEDDSTYKKLQERYDHLTGNNKSRSKSQDGSFVFLQTEALLDFEKKNGLSVIFVPQHLVQDPKTQVSPINYAYFEREGKQRVISVSRSINSGVSRERLSISRCKAHDREFWMVHFTQKNNMPIDNSLANKQERTIDEILNDLVSSNFNLSTL